MVNIVGAKENLQKICSCCIKYAGNEENVQKICMYYRKCAENVLIAENVQKICSYCRKYGEHLRILQRMCRKSAGIAENVQKICRKSVGVAELGQLGQQIYHAQTTVFSCKMIFHYPPKFTSGTYSSTFLFKSFFSRLMVITLRANSLIIHVEVTCEGFTKMF